LHESWGSLIPLYQSKSSLLPIQFCVRSPCIRVDFRLRWPEKEGSATTQWQQRRRSHQWYQSIRTLMSSTSDDHEGEVGHLGSAARPRSDIGLDPKTSADPRGLVGGLDSSKGLPTRLSTQRHGGAAAVGNTARGGQNVR